jgi:hypothetical protein
VSAVVAICPLFKVIGVLKGGTPLKRLDSLLGGKMSLLNYVTRQRPVTKPVESGCLPCIHVVLPACLVAKLRPGRLATELAKLVFIL